MTVRLSAMNRHSDIGPFKKQKHVKYLISCDLLNIINVKPMRICKDIKTFIIAKTKRKENSYEKRSSDLHFVRYGERTL